MRIRVYINLIICSIFPRSFPSRRTCVSPFIHVWKSYQWRVELSGFHTLSQIPVTQNHVDIRINVTLCLHAQK